MSLYRCAACGSPNVVADTQKEGYDYVKGAIGTVVLGVGGAAAGINGKTRQVFKCPDCGLTLNESMPFEIKTLIDMGVTAPSVRKNLKLNGVPIQWEVFTGKYKNIEKDATIPFVNVSATEAQTTAQSATVTHTVDELKRGEIIYRVAEILYARECQKWHNHYFDLMRQRNEEVQRLEDNERARLEDNITAERDTTVRQHTQNKKRYEEKKAAAEGRLATLGFFQFSEKKEAKKQIASLTQLLLTELDSISKARQRYNTQMEEIKETVNAFGKKEHARLEAEQAMPPKPEKPQAMFDYLENGTKTAPIDIVNVVCKEAIFRYIEENGNVTLENIKNNCPTCAGLTNQMILKWIDALVEDMEIAKRQNNCYGVCYSPLVITHAETEVFNDEMQIYKEYLQEKEDAEKRRKQEQAAVEQVILDTMKGRGSMTIDDIKNASSELAAYPTPKLRQWVSQLVEREIITKTTKMYQSYYEYH